MVTYERLHEVLNYDHRTGIFTRKIDRGMAFKVGQEAGGVCPDGYVVIGVDGRNYRAHRLAWLYVHGYLPENEIDHINRDRSDNRICNLREVSSSCNAKNRTVRCNSKTGITGIQYREDQKRFIVRISHNGEILQVGSFIEKIDAAKARWLAEVKYDYPSCNTTSSALEYIKEHDPSWLCKNGN